jgi:hypothetical protein
MVVIDVVEGLLWCGGMAENVMDEAKGILT